MSHQSTQPRFHCFGFRVRILHSARTFSRQGVATEEKRLRACTTVGPSNCLRVLKEDTTPRGVRWPRQAIMTAWCLLFTTKSFPLRAPPEHVFFVFSFLTTKQDTSAIRLCDNQTVIFLCVQTQPQRSSRRLLFCSGSSLLLFSAFGGSQRLSNSSSAFHASHVTTSGSCFLPFRKPQTLSDFMKPPTFRSIHEPQVWSSLPREETRCLPVPPHPAQNVVYHCHWSIAHRFTIRIAEPLKLSKGFRPLLLPYVSAFSDFGRLHFAGVSTRCPLVKGVNAKSHRTCSCVS